MPIVSGSLFAESAYSYNGRGLTYQQYDCTHFTNLVRRTCSLSNFSQGSNAMWRSSALTWKGTIQEARQKFPAGLPQGLYLFHVIPDSDPNADPEHYGYGDGIGDVNHVGILTNIGLGVMQSGGYDGNGVHDSRLRSYFNLAGCAVGIDYTGRSDPLFNNPGRYRDIWVSPNIHDLTSDQMLYNANCVKSMLNNTYGWTLNSVCGVLANMQYESGLNPAYINPTNRGRLPSETQLQELPNYVMQDFNGDFYSDIDTGKYGIGLCQWSTTSQTNGLVQSYMVAYGITAHRMWYDGWNQCSRINTERERDWQTRRFTHNTVNGYLYTFETYGNATTDPADCAEAWAIGYQKTSVDITTRRNYATNWYNYFTSPNAPDPVPEAPVPPYTEPKLPLWLLIKKRKEICRSWVRI